jgi:Intracellular proteinase inhibitor
LPAIYALALAAALLLLAACGGDDDDEPEDNNGSPTASAEETDDGANGDDPSATPGEAGETPAGTAGGPAECDQGDGQTGLLSDLILSGDDGLYPPGEAVTMTLRLVNCGDNEAHLFFKTTQRYIMTIEEQETEVEVWSSATGQTYPETPGEEVIANGETVEYEEVWDQTNTEGAQVPPGLYKVKAYSVGCGQETDEDCIFGPVRNLEITE